MFIPLHDANSLKHIRLQYVTLALIAANVLVYLMTTLTVFDIAERPDEWVLVPDDLTYVTYSFLHGDIWHLGGNMLFLWVFGDNVEDALGHFRFLVFYLACAVAGAFAHGIAAPDSQAPLIGASGAIAGVVAAYLMLHPRVKIWVLALGRIPLRLPASIVLVLWIGFQLFMMVAGGDDEISWAAHLGGVVAGAVLVVFMRRRGVPLFDRGIVTPQAVETAPAEASEPAPSPWGRR
jgi:membrane associated rhomboid family serine protease